MQRSWVIVLFLLSIAAQPARAQFEKLAVSIPSSANAIALLDVKSLFGSPLAAREGWKDKYDRAFASGLCAIPPFAERMILSADIDYEHMQPAWESVVVDLADARTTAMIARATKGVLDPIGNVPAVALRDDSYVVEFGQKKLGAMAPANRQAVARWLREIQARSVPALSAYLKGSLVASEKSQIVMAFDLEDAIPPEVIQAKLATSETLATKKVDVNAVAKALAGMRGVAVEIAVSDVATGRLRVHFRGDASPLVPVALPLLTEILNDLGARVADVEDWQVTSDPQRITFHGPLTTPGMRRVLALIDSPTSAILASEPKEPTESGSGSAKAAASQQYYRSLMSIIEDLRTEAKEAKTFGQNALWFDKWARRIDKMSIQNVDQDLLNFGLAVSAGLRNMARDMRGIGIHSAEQNAQVTASNYSYFADWFYVDAQHRAITARERAKGVLSARDVFRAIENEAARVRQMLTERYEVAF
ncbi:MAG TPA: hypothetical protein VHC22_10550 [Pirellulales bacterium]|nr:hypothetical protein [Pirellulales bacterium]